MEGPNDQENFLPELDHRWKVLKKGNPIPGLYQPSGAELVKVRGTSNRLGNLIVTEYEIVVTDDGVVVGTYRVVAEESAQAVERSFEES